MSIQIDWIGGNCPVQAEGYFDDDGARFYFRARGTSVQLFVDDGQWCWEGPAYEWPDAGWISERLARAYIEEAYHAWKNKKSDEAEKRLKYKRYNDFKEAQMNLFSAESMLSPVVCDDCREKIREFRTTEFKRLGEQLKKEGEDG